MVQVTKSGSTKLAYVCDENFLKLFSSLLNKRSPTLEYELRTSNSTLLTYTSLDEVIAYPNLEGSEIKTLTVKIPYYRIEEKTYPGYRPDDPPRIQHDAVLNDLRATIEFAIPGFLMEETASFTVIGNNEAEALYLFNQIDEQLKAKSLSQTYNYVSQMSIFWSLYGIYFIISLTRIIPAMFSGDFNWSFGAIDGSVLIGAIIRHILPVWLLATLIAPLRSRLFPRVSFVIGAGVRKDRVRENSLNLLFYILLMGGAASVLASYVYGWLNPT